MPIRELRSGLAAKGVFKGKDDKEQAFTLMAANVQRGVDVVRKNPEVVAAMHGRGLKVHGCIYNVGTGELTELDTGEDNEDFQQRMEHFKVG